MYKVKGIISFSIAVALAVLALSALGCIKKDICKTSITMSDVIVAVDPGHGGVDGGASLNGNFHEKDINLGISIKLKQILEDNGSKVIMTRDRDISLEGSSDLQSSRYRRDLDGRRDIIDRSGANVFVSIHANCFRNDPRTKGAIIFYYYASDEGRRLAKCIGNRIETTVYHDLLGNNQLKAKVLSENLFILRSTKIPGVLIETGYMTNPEEKILLKREDFQEAMAKAVYEGLSEYFLDTDYDS